MTLAVAQEARQVLATANPDWLHGAIAEVAALDDKDIAFEEMRHALREYGMESDVANEVVQQFATLVYAFRVTQH